jgi:hypothetical protein
MLHNFILPDDDLPDLHTDAVQRFPESLDQSAGFLGLELAR